jgi:integrase
MEVIDFQSEVVIPQPPLLVQEGGFDAFFADAKVAESLAVGTDGVRSHAEQIPGFRPLGMYYHRDGGNFHQWVGAAASNSRSISLSEFDRLHSSATPGHLSFTVLSDLHPCTPTSSAVGLPDSPCISADGKLAGAEVPSQALHPGTTSSNVNCATPVKRRGKSMSRRTGQAGHIEQSGKWWVVRWWMDVGGQEERTHKRARICPVSGPGVLSKSERSRRAREIIAESGADTVEHFNAVVVKTQETITTFQEQGARWLESLRTRKRKPVALSTTEDWERILSKWLNPHIGSLPLSEINNASLKRLVAAMSGAGLSPKTIDNYVGLVKMVVASTVDAEGEEIYPRKWNHEFIDMPVVEKSKQNTPCFSGDVMTGLAGWKKPRERVLFILCGAAGLRIGEALGIEIDKHIASDFSLLKIRQKARHCKIEARLKTASALRDVDLHPDIARTLKEYVGERKSGFLFSTRNGKPVASSNVIRRHLHPALKKLNFVNPHTGNYKAGNHAFRRFRNTYLRNRTECPEGLYKYWMGHAGRA